MRLWFWAGWLAVCLAGWTVNLLIRVDGIGLMVAWLVGRRWQLNACGDHLWTRRAAILVQLKYKAATDLALLEEVLVSRLDEQDFFIRKAVGWALRELSKGNPAWVRTFVAAHRADMSGLSLREATKYLPQ